MTPVSEAVERLVEVQWDDATIPRAGGWVPIADMASPQYRRRMVRCKSIGYVLADDKYGMALAASIHLDEAAGITIIPRGQIKKVRRL